MSIKKLLLALIFVSLFSAAGYCETFGKRTEPGQFPEQENFLREEVFKNNEKLQLEFKNLVGDAYYEFTRFTSASLLETNDKSAYLYMFNIRFWDSAIIIIHKLSNTIWCAIPFYDNQNKKGAFYYFTNSKDKYIMPEEISQYYEQVCRIWSNSSVEIKYGAASK